MGRTFLVWVIFLLIVIGVIFQFGSIILLFSGALPIPPEAMAELNVVSSEEIAVDLLVGLYSLVAGIALFMMRRIALPLFLASIPIAIAQYAWTIHLHGWDMIMGNGGMLVMVFVFGVGILICFYIWTLDRRGALA
jgi:hypothetical protein